jgi:protein-L-isoaspartate(D-aspartate) O-methyltransferase
MMDVFAEQRHQMVETQISRRGLREERLLAAFEQVPRHLFVSERIRYAAYEDMPLAIGYGQTISQPYIVALMMNLLQLRGDERVLELGTGSGYQAALLGRLAAEVHSIELIPELGEAAAQLLRELGYTNVHVHIGDGTLGWPPAAPYPAIIAAAAAPRVPPPLLEQLTDNGRLVLPVAVADQQLLEVITRHGDEYGERVVTAVAFVPMRGKHGWG